MPQTVNTTLEALDEGGDRGIEELLSKVYRGLILLDTVEFGLNKGLQRRPLLMHERGNVSSHPSWTSRQLGEGRGLAYKGGSELNLLYG